MMDYKN